MVIFILSNKKIVCYKIVVALNFYIQNMIFMLKIIF